MKENKVSSFEGELVWKDAPRTGKTKAGKDWSSIDFVIKYNDGQGNERKILFNVFGNELVNTVIASDLGSVLRVDWRPNAREYNGKWYGNNEVYGITVVCEPEKPRQTELPQSAPIFPERQPASPKETDPDYPF